MIKDLPRERVVSENEMREVFGGRFRLYIAKMDLKSVTFGAAASAAVDPCETASLLGGVISSASGGGFLDGMMMGASLAVIPGILKDDDD
jgi:hypothetical protein